jgi:ABC transporter fused permease/ATP-binding protein
MTVFGPPESLGRIRRLLARAWPHRRRMLLALVCFVCAATLGLVYPAYFAALIDAAVITRDIDALEASALALVGVFAAQALFIYGRYSLVSWVGERVVADLRVEVYAHILTLSPAFFHHARTGELISRLADDVSRVHNAVSGDLSLGARNAITVVGGVIMLMHTSARLTVLMLAVIPPLIVLAQVVGREIHRLARGSQDAVAHANGELQEGIAGIETVQAFAREQHELGRYADAIARSFDLVRKRIHAGASFVSLSTFMNFSALAVIFYSGGMMVVAGDLSPGALTGFMLYTMLVANALETIMGLWTNLQATLGSTTRVFEILDTRPEVVEPEHPIPLERVEGAIRFERVGFAYAFRSARTIDGVDFEIRPGRVCAVVGSSGAGKTTLARLLFRFHDPDEGRITLDGRDIRQLRTADLRQALAWVAQDPILFSGSVRENIRYGRLDATDERIIAAAKLANADSFIQALPDGYETRVGERGVQLSGGQRQRIAIARALLRHPKVLVLDEATSALDAESEALVQEALARIRRDRTTLVIAHRLSTIRDADQILVLDQGRVVESGSYARLLANQGPFARLLARQTFVVTSVAESAANPHRACACGSAACAG